MGPVRIRHTSHDFGWQSSHSVDLAGRQAKMASIEFWIPWRNAHKPYYVMVFQSLVTILPRFYFERLWLSAWAKIKNSEAPFCSREHDEQVCQVSWR